MNAIALDIWADLRERRLVPVAAIMLAALVATPFLLIKPAEEAPPPPPPVTQSAKQLQAIDSKALVKPVESSISDGSALEAFLSKNPFKPVPQFVKQESETSTQTGGSSGSQTATLPDVPSLKDPGAGGPFGGGAPDTGGGGGGGAPKPSDPDTKERKQFTYVLDLTFAEGRESRSFKRFERLGTLPNQSRPLLVFLGVTAKGNEANFLIDSTLVPSGEGRCKPSPTNCAFVYLEPGEEHNFTDAEGNFYLLRIDQIRRVSVASASASASAARRRERERADREPVARTAEGPAPRRRLSLPLLSDFEIEFSVQR